MPKERRKLIIATSPEMERGAFVLGRVKSLEKEYSSKNVETIFSGTGDMASDLFGLAIAKSMMGERQHPIFIFHPDEEVKWPKNVIDKNDK